MPFTAIPRNHTCVSQILFKVNVSALQTKLSTLSLFVHFKPAPSALASHLDELARNFTSGHLLQLQAPILFSLYPVASLFALHLDNFKILLLTHTPSHVQVCRISLSSSRSYSELIFWYLTFKHILSASYQKGFDTSIRFHLKLTLKGTNKTFKAGNSCTCNNSYLP